MDEVRKTAAVVLIGDELLSGKTEDKNGALLIRELRALGVTLRSLSIISDEIGEIAEVVAREAARVDFVLTSGGVGPTHDDLTMQGVAAAFGVGLAVNEALAEHIKGVFGGDSEGLETWLRMAEVPEGCALIYTQDGRWPVYQMRNVTIFPGIPENFRRQFMAIKARFKAAPVHMRTLFVKVDEGRVGAPLRQAAERFEDVSFGSYPILGGEDWRVRVTVETQVGRARLDEAFGWLLARFEPEEIHGVEDGEVVP